MGIEGKTIVFTGKISMTRNEAWALVEAHGGVVGPDISKSTDYLVVGEKSGSKLVRASLLGIKTLSEEQFRDLLKPKTSDETPLTHIELLELESHTIHKICKWCNRAYKIWDNISDYNTCCICELKESKCPNCNYRPIFVSDFGLYHCMLCGLWFSAPFYIDSNITKHIHYWSNAQIQDTKIYKTCIGCSCRIEVTDSDLKAQSYKRAQAPTWVKEWEIRGRDLEVQRIKEKIQENKEREAEDFVKSLTEEQVNALKVSLEVPE